MTDHLEIGTTFEAPDDSFSLEGLPGVASVSGPHVVELEDVYFDTADLDLARSGVTMRRRLGGDDEGWHLKLPTRNDRWGVHAPATDELVVPPVLVGVLRAVTRGAPLEPVALVRTHRAVHRLRDQEGSLVAAVADDRVTSQSPPGGHATPRAWREWVVELVHGEPSLLTEVTARLSRAGAEPAKIQSTLIRALGNRAPRTTPPSGADRFGQSPTAATLVHAWFRDQVNTLQTLDPLVRADAPDAVHQMRVTSRRLRSVLATCRPLLDRQVTDPLRAELKWLGGVLGEVRDAEVMRARLLNDLDDFPPHQVDGVRSFVDRELREVYDRAHGRAVASLSTDRYLTLLDHLQGLVDDPPWRAGATSKGAHTLRMRVRHDWKRLARRVAALDSLPEEKYVEGMHEARKAVKRVRYAAEPLMRTAGRPAKRFVKAMKRLQSSLGAHQDNVVARRQLHHLAELATAAGENAFALGQLQVKADSEAARQESHFHEDWQNASRTKLRRWISPPT